MDALLSDKKLAEQFDVNRATIWRWVQTRGFPAPLKIAGVTRWRQQDVAAWIAAQEQRPAA